MRAAYCGARQTVTEGSDWIVVSDLSGNWDNLNELESAVVRASADMLAAYEANPRLVDEHVGQEQNFAQGGYGRRQIVELIQNGADELIRHPGGKVHVVLTASHLYCANEGSPITEAGIEALLLTHLSTKRGDEIGRFGLGFKSVLGVSNRPEFFSQPVSFGFDRNWAAGEIADVAGDHDAYPTLRIARLLDFEAEVARDPVLGELSAWATTVVRLPLVDNVDWLADQLAQFDSSFLLFSPHVGALTLEDRQIDLKREIRMETNGDDRLLEEDGESAAWRVFSTLVEPSDDAKKQAGPLQHRKELPVVWAVPLSGKRRTEAGTFWAFFPLRDQTTLSGIANAPWQVNDDRTGLLEYSRLNTELLEGLVELVTRSLPLLVDDEDPGGVLELTPARGREARCWGDDVLTSRFNIVRISSQIIPDQEGRLCRMEDLRAAPFAITEGAQEAWAAVKCRPVDWVHPSAYRTPTRRSRVSELLEAIGRSPDTARDWVAELVAHEGADVADSAAAIRVAATAVRLGSALKSGDPLPVTEVESIREAAIVVNSDGLWSPASPEWIWIDGGDGGRAPEVVVVEEALLHIEGARADLETLGIEQVTPMLELRAIYPELEPGDSASWDLLWSIAREIEDPEEAAGALRALRDEYGPFHVRVASGDWKPSTLVLLPGRVLSPGSQVGQSVLVDELHHQEDLELLRAAGVSDGPVTGGSVESDPQALAWRQFVLNSYAKQLTKAGARPSRAHLELDSEQVPMPLAVLPLLSGDASARFAALLVQLPGVLEKRVARHSTQRQRYPSMTCDSAASWVIKKHGLLPTSLGEPRAVSECCGPSMEAHGDLLPVADVSQEVADLLGLPRDLEQVPEGIWRGLIGDVVDGPPEKLGRLLSLALDAGLTPMIEVERPDGSAVDIRQIVAAVPRDDVKAIQGLGLNVALLEDGASAGRLCSEWGLRAAGEFFRVEVIPVDAGEKRLVVELFPDLEAFGSGIQNVFISACREIVIERSSEEGAVRDTVDRLEHEGVIYVAAEEVTDEVLLDATLAEKGWQVDEDERQHMLVSRRSAEGRELLRAVAAAGSVEEKLLLAIGRDALSRRLPRSVIEEMASRRGGALSDGELVQLAMAVHGVEVLVIHKDDLRANGFDAPKSWAAGVAARRFVLGLGLPEEYAGFPSEARDPLVHVPGPPEMPELHDFQRHAADRIRDLIRAGSGRGMLSLPTGAGKTRTAVQAVVEAMREGELVGPVLWVAQTDELCEQAVSAWTDNWRAVGPRETLKLSRLWSGNEAQDLRDDQQVVVATIAKLEVVMPKDEYAWLAGATTVIVDEAHRALSPDYRRLLEWLGMERGKQRVPFIGLSATPFRGTSEQQTKALVNRFDNHRLDDMGEDPYGMLQELGVLSKVDHRLLSGAELELSAKELEELQQMKRLPGSVLERIGEDKGRNQAILDSIMGLPKDWPVLLFAASVPHAELMAGLLSAEGVPSRAISARTHKGARQHYIRQFRNGEVRVLTNFGVLTEGFDAPATRAVYVARPTYSPNLYQQMIGRGLRGPKNGGKDVCLIVNVQDTLAQFGDDLAFTEFEHLWQGS